MEAKHLEQWQLNVVGEQQALADKVSNLYKFIATDKFKPLDVEEQVRLKLQGEYMRLYLDVLDRRMAAW